MTVLDLLVAGGTVVSTSGRRRINIGVEKGVITYAGTERPPAASTVDASGLLVLPGAVDSHIHLMDPGSTEREDFPTGTAAAAVSGVTTIIEHTHGSPVRSVDDLEAKKKYLSGRSVVDYGLAAHAWPNDTDAVGELWDAGVAFFKVFTCTTHGIPGHSPGALRSHLNATARTGAVSMMHCEDESLTEMAEILLRERGRDGGDVLPDWRNRDAEVVAAATAAILVRRCGARAVVAHVSHPEVAEYIARERAQGARLGVESCPQYFVLREHEVNEFGALRKFTPPARARTEQDEADMWRLLREGALTHISSDHAPSTLAQKREGDIWNVHFGLPGVDTTMSVLLDAAHRGHLSYEQIVRVYCEYPAQVYGLWPRKGSLLPGADADIVLVDPNQRRELRDEDILSKAGWTPYAGRMVTGAVVRTYLRGVLVAEEGRAAHEMGGMFLPGAGQQRKAASV